MTCAHSSADSRYDTVGVAVWHVYRASSSHLIAYAAKPRQCVPQGTLTKPKAFALRHMVHVIITCPPYWGNVRALKHSHFSPGHWFPWSRLQLPDVKKKEDNLKVRTVLCVCVCITLCAWLSMCGIAVWKSEWWIYMLLLSLYIPWHFLHSGPTMPFLLFNLSMKRWWQKGTVPSFCCCINQLYSPTTARKWTPLLPV